MTDAAAVLDELRAAWARSDALFAWLRPEALPSRPIPLRHPFVFYLGHLPAFAWNQVARGVLGRPPLEARFDLLFERGIDPPDEAAAPASDAEQWPEISAVLAYRDAVRAQLPALADALADRAPRDALAAGARVLHLVLEHELMHHETLLYMMQALDPALLRRPAEALPLELGPPRARESVEVPPGRATLGTRLSEVPFAWDNELDRLQVHVPGFRLDSVPVTVGEFLAFVDAGGYRDPAWWSPADRAWLRATGRQHPQGWTPAPEGWRVRSLFEDVPLTDAYGWPVYVSYAEATAYARWAGGRLPTEAELHRAAYGEPGGGERPFPWGDDPPAARHGAFDFHAMAPVPVGARPDGASAFGVHELVGNGWEHTATPFGPLPGFRPWARTYPGYSADFFDGRHMVVFGAAWPTATRLLRPSFRNWYRDQYPYVFATFRLVR